MKSDFPRREGVRSDCLVLVSSYGLAEGKLRPALLISDAPGPYDVWLICMISSQLHQQSEEFDEPVEEGDSDFQKSGLKKTSVVRLSRLAVVEGDVLEGRIGRINSDRMQRIQRRLADWIGRSQSGAAESA